MTESIKNSFVEAHYHGVSAAFNHDLGYLISIVQQLLLVQTSDVHEFEQFAAVTRLVGQCYQTLDGVASRLTRAANGETNDKRRSLLLRSCIKEQLQDEIEGLRDMISKNISAVSTMLSIRNITRATSFETSGSGQETVQTRRRSSSAASFEFDDEKKPLLPKRRSSSVASFEVDEEEKSLLFKDPSPKSNDRRPRRASKNVRFEPLPGLDLPPPVYPRQGPLGLSDVVANIEFLTQRFDLESQATLRKSTKEGRVHLPSVLGFLFFFSVSLIFLLYYGIKKRNIDRGIGIMGTLLSVYSVLDRVVPWWYRRRALRLEGRLRG